MLKTIRVQLNPKPKTCFISFLILLSAALSGCKASPAAPPSLPVTAAAGAPGTETSPLTSITPNSRPKQTSPAPGDTTDILYTTSGIRPAEELSMYAEPEPSSSILERIPAGTMGIQGTGKPEKSGDTTWVPVAYRGLEGWVNQEFIAIQQGSIPLSLNRLSNRILYLIKDNRFQELSAFIHPRDCLRFSPYPYLKPENLVVCPQEFNDFFTDTIQHRWGQFDGSGTPIDLTFEAYYRQFIYDQDYAKAKTVGFNQEVSSGNSPNNIPEIYPGAVFIEYHFPEIDPQYGGLDWRSLRLVFKENEGKWYLLAVVHEEWTI